MSETVLNSAYEIVQHGGFTEKDLDAFTRFVLVLGIGHTPIVRCGDRNVVLAVDREELAEAYEDAARKAVDTGNHMAGPLAGVDALLAKLDLREVERIIPIKHGKKMWEAGPLPGGYCEVALLKPSPTSKEGTGE